MASSFEIALTVIALVGSTVVLALVLAMPWLDDSDEDVDGTHTFRLDG
jgi:hypothetical protein